MTEQVNAGVKLQSIPLSFEGSGVEYFKIWLSNLVLTIITLGIYGPWAKVRRERYFLGSTYLAGHSFDFTANPVDILKGRLIVFAAIVVLGITESLSALLHSLTLLSFLIVVPWVITKAIKFKARYTVFRGVPFLFSGTTGETARHFIGYRLLGFLTLGLLYPWARFKERGYLVNKLHYGGTPFGFHGTVGSFYKAYLIVAGLVLFAFGIFALFGYLNGGLGRGMLVFVAVLVPVALLFAPLAVNALLSLATWNHVTLGGHQVNYTVTVGGLLWIMFSNLLLFIVTLGLATPFLKVRLYRYKVENLFLEGPADLEIFTAESKGSMNAVAEQAADLFDFGVDFGL